jgi:hypothetical protein
MISALEAIVMVSDEPMAGKVFRQPVLRDIISATSFLKENTRRGTYDDDNGPKGRTK